MCADIFISYAREDRTTAQLLADAFGEQGWDVWWDREIQGGTAFSTEIERALQSCRAAVVLWSPSAVASDFVRDEARRAMRAGKLLPIRIEAVEPPLGFGETHTLDLLRWDGDRDSGDLIELLNQLRQRLDGATASTRPAPPKPAGSRRRLPVWLASAGGGLAILVLAYGLASHRRSASADCVPPGESMTWEELNQGRERFNEGDLEGARAIFNKVLAAEPGFARARYYLAQVLIRSNETDVAYDMLKGLKEQLAGRNDCAVDLGELKKIDTFMADLAPDPAESQAPIARVESPDAPVPVAAPSPTPDAIRDALPTAISPPPETKPRQRIPLDAEAERRLQAEVEAAFGPNSDHRLEATTALIAAPEALSDAVPLLVGKLKGILAGSAKPDAEQTACVANALNVLQSATPATLNAHRDEIAAVLNQMGKYAGNGAAVEADKLRERLETAEGRKPVAYLQLASDSQRPFADALAAKLRAAGYEVPAYETVGNRAPSDATEIRIQGRSDRELARWMTQALGKLGAAPVRTRSLRKVRPDSDVFEIWFDQGLCAPEGTQAAACKGG